MDAAVSQDHVNKRIADFVRLRDEIKRLEDEHKKQMAPYRETLEKLSNVLMGHLNAVGAESIRAEAGTVYKTEKRSASIADKQAFWDFVMSTQNFDLLDYKANVTAVSEYIDEKHALPPGVNFTSTILVGVRRA